MKLIQSQKHATHIDLTIDKIYRFTKPATLDFGGSEFKSADRQAIQAEKKQAGDDYGWWQLSQGHYQASMNETLKKTEEVYALLTPHHHTQRAGIITNTGFLSGTGADHSIVLNFQVPDMGCRIKENARFAKLHVFTE